MVTHVVAFPPGAGNEIRVHDMLAWFRHQGYETTLILRPLEDREIVAGTVEGLEQLVDNLHIFRNEGADWDLRFPGVDADIDDARLTDVQNGFCPGWLLDKVAAIMAANPPDVVVAQYIFTSRILCLPQCAGALKLIDTHDLFSRKLETVKQYGIEDYGLILTEAQEAALLRRGDAMIAIQQDEKGIMERMVPGGRVVLAGFGMPTRIGDPAVVEDGLVLVVASSNEFNVKGTQDFLDYTWPLVREAVPHARLRVIGRVCGKVTCDDPTVELRGYCDLLDAEYERAQVVVNPCRVGTGLKIKTMEALAWGKSHVAWPSAGDGLAGAPIRIVEDAVSFADEIVMLINDGARRKELEREVGLYRHRFAPEQVYAELTGVVDRYCAERG